MSSSKGYTEKKVLAAIKGSGGIITTISNRLGSDWHTAKKLTQQWQSTRDAYKDERETILDMSESAVLKSIKEGNTQDAKWILSTLGKMRGFNEKLEVEHSGSVETASLTPEERKARIAELLAKR